MLNEFMGYLSLSDADNLRALWFRELQQHCHSVGGLGALVPERPKDLAKLGLRAMAGGLIACYLTATVVGILLRDAPR